MKILSFFVSLFFLIGVFFVPSAPASMVLPLTLEKMAVVADRVFEGECVSIEEDLDENGLPVTYITFAVNRSFKGDLGNTVTMKHFGVRPREDLGVPLLGEGVFVVSGIKGLLRPRFQIGENVILFLYPDSEWGFTSPVGLGQGKFVVKPHEEGGTTVTNGFMGLISPRSASKSSLMPAQSLAIETRDVNYEDFIEVLKTLPTMEK